MSLVESALREDVGVGPMRYASEQPGLPPGPASKHVRYDAEERRWVSEPFTYLPRVAHKPHGRRRLTYEAALRKEVTR